ncbi:hypothetical protein LshimejAT787_0201840 [Lyophyllum shimeji]|uniref:J domain-containing protein n=1 Tax=Lyophyllum shimeji TaxID=47721 RepID=A0A9P3PFR0_LYOSH|nr:hypothetical protein LshimejAT787_0201840 [Lyophyllum shimeji]
MDIKPEDLGPCRNPQCSAGCGVFYAVFSPSIAVAITKCLVCGCFGAQHLKPGASGVPSAPPAPEKAAPRSAHRTYGASTANTMFGSRTASSFSSSSVPMSGAPREFLARKADDGANSTGPFRKHAQDRQENIAGKGGLNEPLSGPKPTFYPAKEAQIASDLYPNQENERRKRKRWETKQKNQTGDKKAKKEVLKVYTVVVVEGTKAVARDTYKKPSATKLTSLSEAGYVKKVELGASFDRDQIRDAVDAAFAPKLANFFAAGWRPLRAKLPQELNVSGEFVRKKGVSCRLRPLKMGTEGLTMENWNRCLSNSSVRGAGQAYKQLIFIALSPSAPNLPFLNAVYGPDTLRHDLPSEESEFEMAEDADDEHQANDNDKKTSTANPAAADEDDDDDMYTPYNSPGPDTAATDNASAHENEGKLFDTESSTSEPGPDWEKDYLRETAAEKDSADAPVSDVASDGEHSFSNADGLQAEEQEAKPVYPPSHLRAQRLLKNVSKPDFRARWWSDNPVPALRELVEFLPLLREFTKLAVDSMPPLMDLKQYLEYINTRLLCSGHVRGIINVSSALEAGPLSSDIEACFDDVFIVGQGGIDVLFKMLDIIYLAFHRIPTPSHPELNKFYLSLSEGILGLSLALLNCVKHFRSKYHRSIWDPRNGIRELEVIYRQYGHRLPVAPPINRISQSLRGPISFQTASCAELSFLLTDLFGDRKDPKEMLHATMIGGEHGLGLFIDSFVSYVLDDMEINDSYMDVIKVVNACCLALARKVRNYVKSLKPNTENETSQSTRENLRRSARTSEKAKGAGHRNTKNGRLKKSPQFTTYPLPLESESNDDMTNTESLPSDWYNEDIKEGGPDIKARRAQRHPIFVPSDPEPEPAPKPPTPPPRPRPRPTGKKPQTPLSQDAQDIQDAQAMLAVTSWACLIKKVLDRFPHPKQKRTTYDDLENLTRKEQYRRMILRYHPDHNGMSPHWQQLSTIITQALNARR